MKPRITVGVARTEVKWIALTSPGMDCIQLISRLAAGLARVVGRLATASTTETHGLDAAMAQIPAGDITLPGY